MTAHLSSLTAHLGNAAGNLRQAAARFRDGVKAAWTIMRHGYRRPHWWGYCITLGLPWALAAALALLLFWR